MTATNHETLLHLRGADAARFLQGQTTADIEGATAGSVLRGAFCDPKGRMLADFMAAVRAPDDILLRVRTSIAESLMVHLKKYLMFSKATLERTDWTVGYVAEDSEGNAFDVIDDRLRIPRGEGLTEIWTHAGDNPGTLDEAQSRAGEIRLEEARVEAETVGQYLPQDLNFDLNGAVSFTKGCYTGQEIIARLHYRGTPKRRLYRARATGASQPVVGQALHATGSERAIGSVVNAAADDQGHILLIETIDDALEAGLTLAGSETALTPW